MLLAALLLILQDKAGAAAVPEAKPVAEAAQSWSIKVDPCASNKTGPNDIVVCGATVDPRLPLRAERGPPDRPVPSNPNLTGASALAATGTPCASVQRGCQVGVDVFGAATFLVRAAGKAVDPGSCCEERGEATNPIMLIRDAARGVGRAFKKKDKRPRIPIPLDDTPMRFPAPGATAPDS